MKNPIQLRNATDPITISLNRSLWRCGFLLIPLTFAAACFAFSPALRADCLEGCGGYFNTFLGEDALLINSAGYNTAIGYDALWSNTGGNYNTAIGAFSLSSNSTGS